MKSHRNKEQCFKDSGLPARFQHAFYKGWYACGNQINEAEDYDDFQERLYEHDFLEKEYPDED